MNLKMAIWIVCGMLLLLACNTSTGSNRIVTLQDAGKTVELKTEQTFRVTLDGNPTTGYLWEVDAGSTAPVRQVGEAEFKPASQAIGAGGQQTLTFRTASTGQGTLKILYHRPWETGIAPEQVFEVHIIVH